MKTFKRLVVSAAGASVLVAGVAMLVLPGPALIVIPIGLAILATEFTWARTLLLKLRARLPQFESNPVPRRFTGLHAAAEKLLRHGQVAQGASTEASPLGGCRPSEIRERC